MRIRGELGNVTMAMGEAGKRDTGPGGESKGFGRTYDGVADMVAKGEEEIAAAV